jgi:hypothetical protein
MAPSVHEETVEPSNDILGILIVNQWESPYIGLKNWMTRDHLPVLILNIRKTIINGNSRILKWRYLSTICLAIFWGYIPLHRLEN